MDYMPLTRGDMVHHLRRLGSLQSLSIWSAQLDFADAELWRAYPNLKGLKVNCLREFSMSDHQTIRNISINGTPKSIVLENLPELLSLNHYHAPVDELRVRNCEKLQSLSIKAKRSEIVNLPGVKTLTIGDYEAIQLTSLAQRLQSFHCRGSSEEGLVRIHHTPRIKFASSLSGVSIAMPERSKC